MTNSATHTREGELALRDASRYVGSEVGGYVLVGALGQGSFGSTFRAVPAECLPADSLAGALPGSLRDVAAVSLAGEAMGRSCVFKLVEAPRSDCGFGSLRFGEPGFRGSSSICDRGLAWRFEKSRRLGEIGEIGETGRPSGNFGDASGGFTGYDALWPEAAALSKCCCEGIPRWLGVARGAQGEYFLKQTLMPGESLSSLLPRPFALEEVYAIGSQLIGLLGHAFSRGVLHGDIRLPNVLFDVESGRVSLVDFGLALFFDPQDAGRVFETDAAVDRMGLADVLLYLLYSDPRRVTPLRGRKAVWFHELALDGSQRAFLTDLFSEERRFESWADIGNRFDEAFAVQ